jgi:hypothetical protein
MKPKILVIMLEFPQWKDASRWGYAANFGMEFGLKASGAEYTIVPATHRYQGHKPFWIDFVRELIGGQRYDQVWLEVVHSHIDDATMEFLSGLAPVRLGFCYESLELLPQEWEHNPNASQIRQEVLKKRLSALTHIVHTDEYDGKALTDIHGLHSMAMPPGFVIPEHLIAKDYTPPQMQKGLFFGTLYGDRAQWLADPTLAGLIEYKERSPELDTEWPQKFDELHTHALFLLNNKQATAHGLKLYIEAISRARYECFKCWLQGLTQGLAVVNLPQWGRAYASRVVEGMAAGRPVITQALQQRPLSREAFIDGEEILLYHTIEELGEHLRRLQKEPQFAKKIACNALNKIRRLHTLEAYIPKLIEWAGQ